MTDETFDIQKLVQTSGIPRRTIYFYVQQGILPPPEGAGLAAYYTREHLLRLQLIPILRARGLRLDEIRERLHTCSLEELGRMLSEAEPAPLLPQEALPAWPGRRLAQYNLPGGVMLLAPVDLNADGERRLRRLLEAAASIYHLPGPTGPDNGTIKPDMHPNEEG